MVVVSYNNAVLTRRAIDALLAQDPPVHFVVWDNASTDNTAPMLKSMNIEYHLSEENVYWTPAINEAVRKYWKGERCIAWLNNDAAPKRTCMGRLAAELRHPEVGLVAPMTAAIGGPQDTHNNPEVRQILSRGVRDPDEAVVHLPARRATFVLGACSMIRADVFHEVGGLDPDMVLGADDHDLCHKVKEHGYEIRVVQSALCDHVGHASEKTGGAKPIWDALGGKCWGVHDRKWEGLYANEEEAGKCHWWGQFDANFQFASGWTDEKRIEMGLPTVSERDQRYATRKQSNR